MNAENLRWGMREKAEHRASQALRSEMLRVSQKIGR